MAQNTEATAALIRKLDSVKKSPSISRHFAELYFNTTVKALNHFSKEKQPVQNFMQRFELRFADYFFEAAEAYKNQRSIPASWKAYYQDSSLSRVQYFLLGANAHINGDIWQAMTVEFSRQELMAFRKEYYRYNHKLKEELFFVYNAAFAAEPKVRFLSDIALGLDRQYIKWMLLRWRKRQIKLALLWFADKIKFERELEALKNKMSGFDKMILREL